jgi:thiamine-phosphate pyrophosphorylase
MKTGDFAEHGATAEVWRAVDASANRAGEALRAVEDMVRFVLDDGQLTRLVKDRRHDLAGALSDGLADRVFLRDVGADVGVGVAAAAPLHRGSVGDVIAANAARAAQALRSLEECAALVSPRAAGRFEPLRYRLYVVERAALAAVRSRDRLVGVQLCVLVDGRDDEAEFDRLVGALLEARVRMLQIRDKRLDARTLAARTSRAIVAARRSPDAAAVVIVNDRADVAAATGADGVHVGESDLPTSLARRVVGPARLVGRTAHDLAEARAAALDGADYLGVGPCFPSETKTFGSYASPTFLREVVAETGLPAFAIGGISRERLDEIVGLGFTRVAVASAVTAAADPGRAAAAIIERLERLARPPASCQAPSPAAEPRP